MIKRLCALLVCFTPATWASAEDAGLYTFEFEEIAQGVWAGVRPDPSAAPVMGNTTFVISGEGVVVYDGGGVPAMADQIIEKVRSLTDAPVTHVVISHWHGDHSFGIHRFVEEYPGVEIVAHEFTRDIINTPRMMYLDGQRNFKADVVPQLVQIVETGTHPSGRDITDTDIARYQKLIEDADELEEHAMASRVVPPTTVFTDEYVIESGGRRIELKSLGHANTEGDIVMWLPEERIVSTGDIVVLPSPYAFNMPPRPWAATLERIKGLDYALLVPGHGPVQPDTVYLDLLIEVAEDIAGQRDVMVADGVPQEEIADALDFSAHEERFTGGSDYLASTYQSWFETPFRAAAVKALTGERMVPVAEPESVPFDDERWDIQAAEHELVEYLGEQALWIQGGAAMLPDVDLTNAIVEFDIAVGEARGFSGLMFRAQDNRNFEHLYIRPHQSGNPDANQYQPVYHGNAAWQLFHGDGFSAPVDYRYDEWMHVKVVIGGTKAEVFIDSDEPVLRINELKRGTQGGWLGLHATNFAPAYFANLRYTQLSIAYDFPWNAPTIERDENMIATWEVSDAFDRSEIDAATQISEEQISQRTWAMLETEPTGIANLGQLHGTGEGANTVFARTFITVDDDTVKQLQLGFSDAATVFVNGKRVYSGDNTYMSRDYRYLGTIGLFDSVALPLEAGENEICIAVTEAFGGWGIMGRITDFGS